MSVTIRDYYSKRLKKKTFGYEVEVITQHERVREAKRGFLTKTEAREEGQRRELEIKKKSQQGYDLSDIVNKDKNKITVKELLDLWLTTKKANVSYKTYKFYEFCCEMIITDIGKIKARALKTENIELAINRHLENGLSSTTAGHYYTVLKIAYNWAVDRGYVIKNPCDKMKKPKSSKSKLQVYGQDQLDKLLDAIKDMTIYIPVILAATTGMRLGEICGLRWSNVDLENGFIQLKEQLQEEYNKLELVPLKTASSKRKIILLEDTLDALKSLEENQKENKNYFRDNYNKMDYVVCQNNGDPYKPTYISRNYRRVLKEYKHTVTIGEEIKQLSLYEILDIPLIRFHDLRHTHATLMLKANIHPKIAADRLGHSDTRLIMSTYSHILPDMQQQAVDALNNMIKNKRNNEKAPVE
ncbi:tyrosine-type recombinase/integrase [Candidatus Clostridium radicumherbarum]|uniref:Tyrosine-type recombinase/integrase n=1 Tax=Candidatus Clostridium radicumherbarum TaxID=3381662 RepID=A0ABW8TU78_9CLOT